MKKVGRKPIPVTDEQRQYVEKMALIGMRDEDIAFIMKMGQTSLKLKFRNELDKGRKSGNATLMKTAFDMATSGKFPAMTIFMLKVRCGMRTTGDDSGDKNKDKPPVSYKLTVTDPIEASKIYQKIMSEG